MKRLLKKVWLPTLLLLYALYRRDRRKTRAIRQMNYALDKADDHIFALTIEIGRLEDMVMETSEGYIDLMTQTEGSSELVEQMMLLHASGYYQQVLFNPDAIILTNSIVNTRRNSGRN